VATVLSEPVDLGRTPRVSLSKLIAKINRLEPGSVAFLLARPRRRVRREILNRDRGDREAFTELISEHGSNEANGNYRRVKRFPRDFVRFRGIGGEGSEGSRGKISKQISERV